MKAFSRKKVGLIWSCTALGIFVSSISQPLLAGPKISAVLRSNEGMKFHENLSPRRLMHDVLMDEFAHSNLINILNKENSANPVRHIPTEYHIGANLIAFELSAKDPVQLSISISLVKDSLHKVVLMESKVIIVPKSDVDSGLKLKEKEFDNSNYGKAVAVLTREAAKEFIAKVRKSGYQD